MRGRCGVDAGAMRGRCGRLSRGRARGASVGRASGCSRGRRPPTWRTGPPLPRPARPVARRSAGAGATRSLPRSSARAPDGRRTSGHARETLPGQVLARHRRGRGRRDSCVPAPARDNDDSPPPPPFARFEEQPEGVRPGVPARSKPWVGPFPKCHHPGRPPDRWDLMGVEFHQDGQAVLLAAEPVRTRRRS